MDGYATDRRHVDRFMFGIALTQAAPWPHSIRFRRDLSARATVAAGDERVAAGDGLVPWASSLVSVRLGRSRHPIVRSDPRAGVKVKRIASAVALCGVALGLMGQQPRPERMEPSTFGGEKAFTRPSQDAVMGFALPTTLRELLVKGGDVVKKGDLLARGDDAEENALLESQRLRADSALPVDRAQKAVELQRFEYDQLLNLEREGGGSAQELERARLSLEAAKIDHETAKFNQDQERVQVARVEARVDRYRIRAPFDGSVDTIFVDVGTSLSDSDNVLRVVDIDPLEIDVAAPTEMTLADESAGREEVRVGQPAWVLMDLPGRPRVFVGTVTEVSAVADSRSATRRIRVEVPNPSRVLAGVTAYVRFTEPEGAWRERVVDERARAESVGATGVSE